jgi:tetratricopeptide (TPR) repeat protein
MSFSRVGIFVLILLTIFIGANCSYYNRIITRKNLVDGGKAYKDRKFQEAEQLFRDAIARDPQGATMEGKTAQLFLARTLHSEYIGNRQNNDKAEEAIKEYKNVLAEDIKDSSSFSAVANLLENLNRQDEWLQWVTARSNNEQVPPEQRAEALTKLAAKKYSCANDISDIEPVKKTVTKDGKPEYVFSKPQDPNTFEEFKKCVAEGNELTDKAVKLDPNSDAVWSYRANMLVQQMRLAEMEGKPAPEQEAIKAEAEKAKERFTELARIKREKEEAAEARKKAEAEAAAGKK